MNYELTLVNFEPIETSVDEGYICGWVSKGRKSRFLVGTNPTNDNSNFHTKFLSDVDFHADSEFAIKNTMKTRNLRLLSKTCVFASLGAEG